MFTVRTEYAIILLQTRNVVLYTGLDYCKMNTMYVLEENQADIGNELYSFHTFNIIL